jgi:hypothetical protein
MTRFTGLALACVAAAALISAAEGRTLASESSFPNGRPGCQSMFEDFNDPSVLAMSPYNVDTSKHRYISEEPNGFNNVDIEGGNLNIRIVRG